MAKRKTHEEFVKELNKVHGEGTYIPLEKYVNIRTKILVRHNKCGYEWSVIPYNLLRGRGCPICGVEKSKIKQSKTREQFLQEIKEMYGDEYIILGEYINANTKIKIRHNCEKCHYHQYEVTPSNLLQGNGCPVCSGRIAKLGVNTIWDTDRWMCNLGVSEVDAKRYSRCSNKKITVICPDCGKEKEMQIGNIYNYRSIKCPCGDGKSYPEKFVLNLLEQLGVNFEIEYSPNWIENKRYDFYIPKFNMIIETHGGQHYNNGFEFKGGRALVEEQSNDKYKKEVALSNEIKYYIELDCRESNLEWIKNSILNSKLAKIFDLSKVNWNKCAEFANKNMVKEVCDYWNKRKEGETTNDVAKVFKIARTSVINYLKKGNKLCWCSYNAKEEMKKICKINGKSGTKKVEVFKSGKSLGVFESCVELSRLSEKLFGVNLIMSNISNVCLGKRKSHKGFTFKYVEEDNNLNINKIA